MMKKIFSAVLFLLVLFSAIFPPLASAQRGPPRPSPTPIPSGSPRPGSTDLWCVTNETLNTAIGCIPILTTKEAFLSFVLKWAIGIGGGIAFLLIIYSSFMIMTSQGNPERLQAGKELLTSAVSGLILLIFSVFILRIIGIDILGIPGFGTGP